MVELELSRFRILIYGILYFILGSLVVDRNSSPIIRLPPALFSFHDVMLDIIIEVVVECGLLRSHEVISILELRTVFLSLQQFSIGTRTN